MLNINGFLLVAGIEIIILLVMLVIFLWYLLIAKNKKFIALTAVVKSYKEVPPTASLENYLSEEINSIETRCAELEGIEDPESDEISEADYLVLRKSVLEIERELLVNESTIETFWGDMGGKIKKALGFKSLKKQTVEEDPKYEKNKFNNFGDK